MSISGAGYGRDLGKQIDDIARERKRKRNLQSTYKYNPDR